MAPLRYLIRWEFSLDQQNQGPDLLLHPREFIPEALTVASRTPRARDLLHVVGLIDLTVQVLSAGSLLEGIQDHVAADVLVEVVQVGPVGVGDDGANRREFLRHSPARLTSHCRI